jgi:ribosomal protein S18 acetylase RimI-like enzyme
MTWSRAAGSSPGDGPEAHGPEPVRAPGPIEIEPRTDTSPAALRAAIREDLVRSATRRRRIAGERTLRTPELAAYLCDLPSAEVNVVADARLGEGDAADRSIAATMALFGGRPFIWWVGEDDTPADLSDRLNRLGVGYLDDIPGMAMDLADLAAPGETPPPAGLRIEPALEPVAIDAFHAVLIQGFPEEFAGDGVQAAIAEAGRRLATETDYREPNGLPTRWVGTVDGTPVTTTRLHTAAGVAGIYAVVTAVEARRRGYGEAITRHVLHAARDAGLRIATLQASSAGRGVYERIGFRERYRYRLHEWRPAPVEPPS